LPPFMDGFLVVAGIWLLSGTIWGWLSGWNALAGRYPDRREPPLAEVRGQSGYVGNVGIRGMLSITACASGLRVSVWRFFCPWARPFFVPWDVIHAGFRKASPFDLLDKVTLRFPAGKLTLMMPTWVRLSKGVAQMEGLLRDQ
jgi:hypothetical protein